MQEAVQQLVALAPVAGETVVDQEVLEQFHAAAEALVAPATDDEAIALLDVLPGGDDSLFGGAWALVHFIETAPGWPIREALDDRCWWVTFLRERAERGGLL